MRYAFLAMVAVYLITFFGCSPDEQKESPKPAAISQQQTEEKTAAQKQSIEEQLPAEEAPTGQSAEEQVTRQLDKAEKQVARQLEDQQKASAATKVKPEEPDALTENEQKEGAQDKVAAEETLTEAIDQMEIATRELIQLTGVLVTENQRLKGIVAALVQNTTTGEKAIDVQQQPTQSAAAEQSAVQELKEAINKVEDSAQKLTSEVSSKAKEVIAEQSEKAKKAAKEFTEKAVTATNAALDNAKAAVNETGEAIDKKLTPRKETAE